MLTTAAACQDRAAQAMRSVPLAQSAGVISQSAPNAAAASAMRWSSVSTTTRSRASARLARRQTCSIIGLPAIGMSTLPGSRVDA